VSNDSLKPKELNLVLDTVVVVVVRIMSVGMFVKSLGFIKIEFLGNCSWRHGRDLFDTQSSHNPSWLHSPFIYAFKLNNAHNWNG
jgi:hypothetical protein